MPLLCEQCGLGRELRFARPRECEAPADPPVAPHGAIVGSHGRKPVEHFTRSDSPCRWGSQECRRVPLLLEQSVFHSPYFDLGMLLSWN